MKTTATRSAPALDVRHLRKSYPDFERGGRERTTVLEVQQLRLERGEQCALSGQSGSGKTTLLHAIAGLIDVDTGSVELAGRDVQRMPEAERDRWRARHLGYVFQSHHLLQGLTALENVCLPMLFAGRVDEPRARALLDRVGLADRAGARPRQLSVGQRQRVAVARALACKPALVLADEPTGSLDAPNAMAALQLLRATCRENDCALLLVTHDPLLRESFERRIALSELAPAKGVAP